MHLMYLTFGDNLINHYQANFSILTFLNQKSKPDSITIFTDFPEFYTKIKDYVRIVEIDKKKIKEWEGEYRFFWRVKIKAIECLIDIVGNEPILYLDSDTFLFRDMENANIKMLDGIAFMHENEGNLNSISYKTERLMWKQIKNKTFGGITISDKHCMWNAGVVAIPPQKNKKAIKLALQICDDMCKEKVTRRLIEQFALSVALDETYSLEKLSWAIGHYWGNKEDWNKLITDFFIKNYLYDITLSDSLNELSKIKLMEIPTRKRISNTRLRLINKVKKIFPIREILYANQQ